MECVGFILALGLVVGFGGVCWGWGVMDHRSGGCMGHMVNWGRMVDRKNWGVVDSMMYWGRMMDRDYWGVVDSMMYWGGMMDWDYWGVVGDRMSNSMSKMWSMMTMRY